MSQSKTTEASAHWRLHPQLLSDSIPICQLPVCSVRLLDDQRYPWVLLIPRIPDLGQWLDVPLETQHLVLEEIHQVSQVLQKLYAPDRINLATIGNRVEQLHIHCIARHQHDATWPDVVWGRGQREAYKPLQRLARANAIGAGLKSLSQPNS
ncbi:histidine triad (HIT) protein [Halothiobacillus diazotrophicus]|uniref:Histidine triad (HIT) protein n=1 Tax=Halothiobacillus diazotrophicus TaxID=1860122 RepID=A0A191ZGE4_9GAMM|nr:HIT family protein [Halothiobacillus diazotrophicus]ANJ66956.1 histidine triad (HIT) protein [Halothiobacillus diazotrophicus]